MKKKAGPGTARKQLGRPCLNPETVRSRCVVTFVTSGELAMLESMREQKGTSLSAVIHHILSGFLVGTNESDRGALTSDSESAAVGIERST
jgi:LDH2 family malate/lactate/ureidoglycolate dehydrogenase